MITITITHTVSGEGGSTAASIIKNALVASGRRVVQTKPQNEKDVKISHHLGYRSILIVEQEEPTGETG